MRRITLSPRFVCIRANRRDERFVNTWTVQSHGMDGTRLLAVQSDRSQVNREKTPNRKQITRLPTERILWPSPVESGCSVLN